MSFGARKYVQKLGGGAVCTCTAVPIFLMNCECTGTSGGQHLCERRLGITWSGKDWKSIGDSQPQYPRVRNRNPLLLCSEYLCASEGHVEMQSTVRQGQLSRRHQCPWKGCRHPVLATLPLWRGQLKGVILEAERSPYPIDADPTAILTLKVPASGAKGMNVSLISHPL